MSFPYEEKGRNHLEKSSRDEELEKLLFCPQESLLTERWQVDFNEKSGFKMLERI